MKIKLLDNKIIEVENNISVYEISKKISISLSKKIIAGKVDEKVVPINYKIQNDSNLELLLNTDENFEKYINITSGFIASYALSLTNEKNELIDLFYNKDEMEYSFTFDSENRIQLDSLNLIQNKINDLIKNKVIINFTIIEDIKELNKIKNEYQKENAINIFSKNKYIYLYNINHFNFYTDQLILSNYEIIKENKLTQLTGAYWKNNSNNIMFQKIHGMCAIDKKTLLEKENLLEEKRSFDHRNINKTLKIFGFDNLIGPGLPLWLPNGTIVKEEIKKYLKEKEWEYDYTQIETPIIGTINLYKTSGHWDHYSDDMFHSFGGGKNNDEQFMLRPMNCPHHISVYKQELRSYKDLPIRFAEHATQFRYESSGSLTGLERVRGMELTDSHIFVRPDQLGEEFKKIYKLINEVLETFDIKIDYLSLSLRDKDNKEKYFDNDKIWNKAETELENVLKELKLDYKKIIGEAAFYGPKLDIQIKTAQNHEITVSTIQLDFVLPEKFDLKYIDNNQEYKTPIMIHRGLIGTYERFIATLLEQTKGNLPLWISPKQIEILPVNDECLEYCLSLKQEFKKHHIRSSIDNRDERLSYKIRDAQISKVPYQIVVGQKEIENNNVTYREYGSTIETTISKNEFIKMILNKIKNKI